LNAAGIAAVQAWINDPSSNFGIIIQDYSASDGVDIATSETSNASRRPKLVINYETPAPVGGDGVQALTSPVEPTEPPVLNLPPVVSAGIDDTTQLGTPMPLDGTVTDDGQPTPVSMALVWTKYSGPGAVMFGNDTDVDTTASFTAAGTYVLRLTANDGEHSIVDDVTITVSDPPSSPASNPNPAPGGTPTQIEFQDGLFPYVSYAGTTDTKIASGKATTNYGAASSFDVDTNVGALLRWDVSAIPKNSIIVSAAIELYVTNSTKQNFEVYALQRAWDELSATWQQYAAGKPWAGVGAMGGGDSSSAALGELGSGSQGIHRIELNEAGVAAVQAWISDPDFNYDIILQDYAESDGVDFYSSEYKTVARRPKLVVNYDASAT
jgi:hypothetical protein